MSTCSWPWSIPSSTMGEGKPLVDELFSPSSLFPTLRERYATQNGLDVLDESRYNRQKEIDFSIINPNIAI